MSDTRKPHIPSKVVPVNDWSKQRTLLIDVKQRKLLVQNALEVALVETVPTATLVDMVRAAAAETSAEPSTSDDDESTSASVEPHAACAVEPLSPNIDDIMEWLEQPETRPREAKENKYHTKRIIHQFMITLTENQYQTWVNMASTPEEAKESKLAEFVQTLSTEQMQLFRAVYDALK